MSIFGKRKFLFISVSGIELTNCKVRRLHLVLENISRALSQYTLADGERSILKETVQGCRGPLAQIENITNKYKQLGNDPNSFKEKISESTG